MMWGGYCGTILHVDLDSGKMRTEALDPDMARKYAGDFGINLRLAYDLIEPGIDPFSPKNALIFGAGPLVGTRIQAPRWSGTTKMPLTNAISCANAGMGFGTHMKRAGYDHLVITGRSPRPVYLKISDDSVELCEGGDLWGRDTFDTTDLLLDRLGRDWSVTAIGQAAENRVRHALALVDKSSTLGKGGLGAVMASKNLKAVAIRGTRPVSVADYQRWNEVSGRFLKLYKEDPVRQEYLRLGKMQRWEANLGEGFLHKNGTELYPKEEANRLFGVEPFLRHFKKRVGCMMCSYRCKDALEIQEGEDKGLVTYPGSTVGRPKDVGTKFCLENYDQFLKVLDVYGRYGLCTQTFSSVVDFAIELFEKGIITLEDTGGLTLKRDFPTAMEMARLTAFREGIGDILADGSPGLIARFGQECESYSLQVKGLEQQADARLRQFNTTGLGLVVNPEGANSGPGGAGSGFRPNKPGFSRETIKAYARRMDIPQATLDKILNVKTYYNVGRLQRYSEDFFVLLTSLGICEYRSTFYDWNKLGELYSASTGIEMTPEEMKLAGERIWNLYKAINVREGFDRKDDRFPDKWLQPLRRPDGTDLPLVECSGEGVTRETFNQLLDDYYDERGWDVARGIPTREKLSSLGMGDIAEDLSRRGML